MWRLSGNWQSSAMAVKKYLTLVASERYLGCINDEEKDNIREA